MSETKFTPGPWTAVNDGSDEEPMWSVKASRITGRPPRHVVALCATGDSPQEMETANARLIAAAPEMYAALRDAQMALADRREADAKGYTERARKSVDAALAEAEGRS